MTSFSMVISCWGVYSGILARWRAGRAACSASPPPIPNRSSWPSTFRLRAGGDAVQHLAEDLHQLGALTAHAVKGAGLDKALQHPPVQVMVEHAVAEVHKVCKGSTLAPLFQQAVDDAPAHTLQGHQAEADAPLGDGESPPPTR